VSTPVVQGLPLHTRSLTVSLSRKTDERWSARGDIIDLRKNGFVPSSYDIQPAGIIHSMNIELDLVPETLEMEAIRVDQPFVAVEPSEATRGECCRDPAPRLLDLAGERLDGAFPKKLTRIFGGPLGCSHLLTLFQLMASAVPRGAAIEHARAAREGTEHAFGDRFFRRAVFIDGLQASRAQTDVSVQLSDSATRPFSDDTHSVERLELFHEVKTLATVERKRLQLERLEVRERSRSAETLTTAPWADHSERLASLVGAPIIPGLAGRIFALTAAEPALGPVQDNLLMFAPGFIQVTAAQMEGWFEEQARAKTDAGESTSGVSALGGNSGACYMWRENGPIQKAGFGTMR